ncbi:hypothetical protein GCM10011594_26000 [Nakamurella endophytica]|uniref:SCP2 domain-containing protein n=1 Tax=Nakamurella endophytica TaxID=1748367 RepID=A0A917T069_9ACTN|nr:hypothetical protein GCM10011594_26000 [Nakamurella endophytica]
MGVAAPAGSTAYDVHVETDPTPLVSWIGRLLRDAAGTARGRAGLAELAGCCVGVRQRQGRQSVTATFTSDGCAVVHGVRPAVTDVVEVDLDDELRVVVTDQGPSRVLQALLCPPLPDWRSAAEGFWSRVRTDPGMPATVQVRCRDESLVLGDGLPRYEILGEADDLAKFFTGRTQLLSALKNGRLSVRGTFPQLSVMVGASWKARWNG